MTRVETLKLVVLAAAIVMALMAGKADGERLGEAAPIPLRDTPKLTG